MKKTFILLSVFLFYVSIKAQEIQKYKNGRGESHLCGIFPVDVLEKDTLWASLKTHFFI